MGDDGERLLDAFFPYRRRFATRSSLPATGVGRAEVLAMVDEIAGEEDAIARAGRVSGSIYHGGEEHFAFLAEVFRRFAHVNVLQRDMYPSATKFEGEIVAMVAWRCCTATRHGEGDAPCGVVTSGGSESLMNAVQVYRERGRERGIDDPQVVVPLTGARGDRQGRALPRRRGRPRARDRRVRGGRRRRPRAHRPADRRAVRLGGHLSARARRSDRASWASSRSSTTFPCTSTAAWAG